MQRTRGAWTGNEQLKPFLMSCWSYDTLYYKSPLCQAEYLGGDACREKSCSAGRTSKALSIPNPPPSPILLSQGWVTDVISSFVLMCRPLVWSKRALFSCLVCLKIAPFNTKEGEKTVSLSAQAYTSAEMVMLVIPWVSTERTGCQSLAGTRREQQVHSEREASHGKGYLSAEE